MFQCLCFLAVGGWGQSGNAQSPALTRWQSSAGSHRALCLEPSYPTRAMARLGLCSQGHSSVLGLKAGGGSPGGLVAGNHP